MTTVRNFIGGEWVAPDVAASAEVRNPATGAVIAHAPLGGPAEVDAAVAAARAAFPGWSRTPAPQRARLMFRYRELLETHAEALARLVTWENGKTLEEARGDVRRGIEVVEFACGIVPLLKGTALPQVAAQIDAATAREPVGVCAGITPFNFPAMVPLWMFPLAIASGNAFVLKPSEKVPLTAARLVELFAAAGLPPGVLNLVCGGREAVEALCRHPEVAAVSFVGSTAAARHVYSLGGEHGKRVQAAGGAKNVLVVLPDAEPESTCRAIVNAAFGCAGQRCMAGSLLMGVGAVAAPLRERLVAALDALKVADPLAEPDAGMGPVIDAAARARVIRYLEEGTTAGAALARDGRQGVPERGFFVGPTLLDEVTPGMSLFRDEIFGPLLSMLRPASLDEAIEWANRTGYGNGAVIFTGSGRAASHFTREVQCGMVGVNVGVPAPLAFFPFSGWNGSFYGDLHVQGEEGVLFYTRQKVVLSRWDEGYQSQGGW